MSFVCFMDLPNTSLVLGLESYFMGMPKLLLSFFYKSLFVTRAKKPLIYA